MSQIVGPLFSAIGMGQAANTENAIGGGIQAGAQGYQPWTQLGGQSANQLQGMLAPGGQLAQTQFGMNQAQQDPMYSMMMANGGNALAAYASSVGQYGGSTMASGLQDVQLNAYQQAYNNWNQSQNNLYQRLLGTSQQGLAGQSGYMGGLESAGGFASQGAGYNAGMWGALGQGIGGIGDSYLTYQALSGAGGGVPMGGSMNTGGIGGLINTPGIL